MAEIDSNKPQDTSLNNGQKKKTGPKPDSLKIEENWENALKKAVTKKKPKEGWPETKKE